MLQHAYFLNKYSRANKMLSKIKQQPSQMIITSNIYLKHLYKTYDIKQLINHIQLKLKDDDDEVKNPLNDDNFNQKKKKKKKKKIFCTR